MKKMGRGIEGERERKGREREGESERRVEGLQIELCLSHTDRLRSRGSYRTLPV